MDSRTAPHEPSDIPPPDSREVRRKYALELLEQEGLRPAAVVRAVMAKFGISRRTAYDDLRIVNAQIREAIEEMTPYYAATVKEELGRLARAAEKSGDYKSAVQAMTQLGKFCGVSESSDAGQASKLTAEELQAQLDAAIRDRIEAMDPAEIAAVLARKADPSPTSTAGEPAAVTIGKEP